MRLSEKHGQSTVELALILPFLLLVLFAIMEFGRIFSSYLIITNAAREGARQASIGADNNAIIQTVRGAAYPLNSGSLTINIDPYNKSERITGSTARVTVNYSVDILIPLVGRLLPDPFPLTAQAAMRVE
ncbi:MAG: pilus assembly protein [Firmicutes bacterium]|nr:pilus assembly protein [Bacillota bacterium]